MAKRKVPIDLAQCKRLIKKQRYRDALEAFEKSVDRLIMPRRSSRAVDIAKELKRLAAVLEDSFKKSYFASTQENRDRQQPLVCSFCGKADDEVRKLIAGPTVYICDECVDLCNDIIAEELKQDNKDDAPEKLIAEDARECTICSKLRRLDDVVYIPALKQYFCVKCVEASVITRMTDKPS